MPFACRTLSGRLPAPRTLERMHSSPEHDLQRFTRDIATRAIAVVGLAGIALIHLLDAIGKWSETRYLFWMYVALMLGSLALAGLRIDGVVINNPRCTEKTYPRFFEVLSRVCQQETL